MRRLTMSGFIFGVCLLAAPAQAQEDNPCQKPIVLVRTTGGLIAYLGSPELGDKTKINNVMFKFHPQGGLEPIVQVNAAPVFTMTTFFGCGSMPVPLPAALKRDGVTVYDVYVQFENSARLVSGWTKEPIPFVLGDPPATAKPPLVPTLRLGVS
jgi:hypothetical protein